VKSLGVEHKTVSDILAAGPCPKVWKSIEDAIKRANKVRDFQAKANRPRRSEMQHCKLVSGANNNRSKCCY